MSTETRVSRRLLSYLCGHADPIAVDDVPRADKDPKSGKVVRRAKCYGYEACSNLAFHVPDDTVQTADTFALFALVSDPMYSVVPILIDLQGRLAGEMGLYSCGQNRKSGSSEEFLIGGVRV